MGGSKRSFHASLLSRFFLFGGGRRRPVVLSRAQHVVLRPWQRPLLARVAGLAFPGLMGHRSVGAARVCGLAGRCPGAVLFFSGTPKRKTQPQFDSIRFQGCHDSFAGVKWVLSIQGPGSVSFCGDFAPSSLPEWTCYA